MLECMLFSKMFTEVYKIEWAAYNISHSIRHKCLFEQHDVLLYCPLQYPRFTIELLLDHFN